MVERYKERLKDVKGIKIWEEQSGVIHNYAYFPVLFDEKEFGKNRDDVAYQLSLKEVFARKYFYPITSLFDCYKGKFEIQTGLQVPGNPCK